MMGIVVYCVYSDHMIITDAHTILNLFGLRLMVRTVLVLQPTGLYDLVPKRKVSLEYGLGEGIRH